MKSVETRYKLWLLLELDCLIEASHVFLKRTVVTKSKARHAQEATTPVQHLVHTVSVTYANRADAVQDKTGKPVKELRLSLQQFDYPLQAGKVYEFSFTSQDYEKIASRDFEVAAYF